MKLRYNIKYVNERGLIRTEQVIGKEARDQFIAKVENDSYCDFILCQIHTI